MDDLLKQLKGANQSVKKKAWNFLKQEGSFAGTGAKSVKVKPSQKGKTKTQEIKKPDGSVKPKVRPSSRKPAKLPYSGK